MSDKTGGSQRPCRLPGLTGWVSRLARIAIGLVFLLAAYCKWRYPSGQSYLYGHLAHAAAGVGIAVIIAEVIVGFWLLSGIKPGMAAVAGIFLLAVFSGAIIADMRAAHPLPCGCFGAAWKHAHEPAVIEHKLLLSLVRNGVLGTAAVVVYIASGRRRFTASPRGDTPHAEA